MGSPSQALRIRIAIAGGGIAGLCLARGLSQYEHLDVQVYEAAAEFLEVGAGLALHANAIRAMELIDPEIKRTYFRKANIMASDDEVEMATQVVMAEGRFRGETIAALGRAKGRKTVARADLLEGLLGLVPAERVHFGKRLSRVSESEDGVVLHFADGKTAAAHCLIGADGTHSAVRKYLLGDHPSVEPKNHERWYRVGRAVPMEEARNTLSEKYLTSVPILCGSQGYFNSMPLHYGKTLSVGVVLQAKTEADIGKMPPDEAFEEYDEDCRKMLQLIRKEYDPNEVWVILDHDAAPYYNKGRIAMMGDAAHATAPFTGNGAAQAIEDSAVLNALFGQVKTLDEIPCALAAFDGARRPRSSRVVEIAREVGQFYHYRFGDAWKEEDGIERLKERFKTVAAFTNDADLSVQNQQAVDSFQELKMNAEALR